MTPKTRQPQKFVQLIAIDDNQNVFCYQRCKLIVNKIIKKLIITPFDDDHNSNIKPFAIPFNESFVFLQNIILINQTGAKNNRCFILFFSSTETCTKLFTALGQKNVLDSANILLHRFLDSIMEYCKNNNSFNFELFKLLKLLITKFGMEQNHEILEHLNQICSIYENSEATNIRKRKHSEAVENNAKNKYIKTESFKIVKFERGGILRKRLIVFISTENETMCHEYFWNAATKSYECCGCGSLKKRCFAKIFKSFNDSTNFVKYRKHICEPRKYNPEKYNFDPKKQIIEASNFEIIKYEKNGEEKTKLRIFPFSERNFCYNFFWESRNKAYYCSGCKSKNNTNFKAKICQKDGRKYVKLDTVTHVCEMKIYISDKYIFNSTTEILIDNFKVMTFIQKGMTQTRLIIFDKLNTNLCYEYYYWSINECYQCCGCRTKDASVMAYLYKNEAGKDFVKLSKTEHICDLREFDEEKYRNHIIINKPNFEYMEHFLGGNKLKKLIIFTSNDKEECYLFTHISDKKYCCSKCSGQKYFLSAFSCQDIDGNEYISVTDKKHICKPTKYEPQKYSSTIIKSPAYQIINRKLGKRYIKKLIVFDTKNDEFCYEYYWSSAHKFFKCSRCHVRHKISVTAKLAQNDIDGEHLILGPNQHECELIKFKPEQRKIIKIPNFKLNISADEKSGAEKKNLIIYDLTDTEKFYSYNYDKKKDQYFCGPCQHQKKYVIAKIFCEKNGENFVELGENEHICAPRIAPKIVKKPNYKIINYSKNGKRRNALIIFDSTDKTLCYQYSLEKLKKKSYICDGCSELGTKNLAIVREDKTTNEEFIEVHQTPHICEKKVYKLENFIKIVKLPNFKVETGIKNGEERKYLIIYSILEKKLGYKYYFCKTKKHFICCECQRLTKTTNIIAKFHDEKTEDGNFVELGEKEHICTPQRYD